MPRTLTRRRTARDTEAYSPADEPEDEHGYTEEEDEAPARGSRRGSRRLNTEDADTSSRRSRRPQEDDEDDEPAPKVGGKGWGSYEKTKQASSGFPDNFKASGESVIVHFLDEEPFLVFLQHWIERSGKKSFTCLEKNCPLCDDAGDKPSQQIAFNVIDFTDPEDPQIKVWQVGPMVADILKNYSKDKKTAPINRDDLYFSVRRETKNKKTNYYITPVKERDLLDDWDIEPLGEEELEEFDAKAYDESILQVTRRNELKTLVREILND
ncbi:hypothetical protein ACFRNJ_12090 [Streptomyces sp. NPDC056721]|uniref:hypothetical protein n=1 Tax=Streptomyces sp. NPDC056721 TaxID=3345923 RepID=UPI0036894C4B